VSKYAIDLASGTASVQDFMTESAAPLCLEMLLSGWSKDDDGAYRGARSDNVSM